MKIVEIRGHEVGFTPSPSIDNALTFIRRRDFRLLEIVTDQDVSSWGEVFSSPFAAGALIGGRLRVRRRRCRPADGNLRWGGAGHRARPHG